MRERPILFSAPMVRAILEGRKTVTRRKANPQPDFAQAGDTTSGAGFCGRFTPDDERLGRLGEAMPCPFGQPGDRLWVREAWATDAQVDAVAPRNLSQGEPIHYPADGSMRQTGCSLITLGKTRPSIHMPRWASRILLEITAVRVERLQEGEGEAAYESRYIAEGINRIHHGDGEYYFHALQNEAGPGNWCDPFDAWRELWALTNGMDSWAANPWVWVIEFKPVSAGELA